MKPRLAVAGALLAILAGGVGALDASPPWTPLAHLNPDNANIGLILLLSEGTVMAQDQDVSAKYRSRCRFQQKYPHRT